MSQVRLTHQERIEAVCRLGYTEREAHFLCLAALHGGYFVRRQYCQFLRQLAGGNAASLIEKALAAGHVTASSYASNTHLYHLGARPFYAALGQEDNRNRRTRQPSTIKNKLMGLDFVLIHPQHTYVATEQEKLEYFNAVLQIEHAALPFKRYASRGQTTDRYFIEKYPIFLGAGQPSSPVVSFCFVDEGLAGMSAFETFLNQYGRLFAALTRYDVHYVAATDHLFSHAARAFEKFTRDVLRAEPLGGSQVPRMLAHFELRRLYETQQWNAFDRAKLIRLRDERHEFSGERWEMLYALWRNGGAPALENFLERNATHRTGSGGSFQTCRLDQNYDLFGRFAAHR